jgi:ketosteroid isomerase-like protein
MTAPIGTMTRDQRKALAVEYLKRLDGGGDVLELFAPDADVCFPKWGVARGTEEIGRLFGDVGRIIARIRHHCETVNIVVEEDMVVVEGTSDGTTADGVEWRAGVGHAGRWCDVFEIRDGAIQRCFVYLDPDYAGADTDRYPWLSTETTNGAGP